MSKIIKLFPGMRARSKSNSAVHILQLALEQLEELIVKEPGSVTAHQKVLTEELENLAALVIVAQDKAMEKHNG